jgi:D-sedoheptulose 7-phosphate isomerase
MVEIMDFIEEFQNLTIESLAQISQGQVRKAIAVLKPLQTSPGRLFIAGSGGGAGHASHAAADFRRLTGIESYALGDNVSELTALINDESWSDSYKFILQQSRLNQDDVVLFFSVGGGDETKNISTNLVNAAKYSREMGCQILCVVGEPGGYIGTIADAPILIPVSNRARLTPVTESLQAYVWHMLVSHPELSVRRAMWESVEHGK